MKAQFSQPVDFNQMLVFSVLVHLLLLSVVLFLPKPRIPEKVVVPAFMVNLVSEPEGFKSAAPKVLAPPKIAEEPKGQKPIEKIATSKEAPASKSAKVKEVKRMPKVQVPGILEELNKLETKMSTPPGKTMVEELDQLARLEKPKGKPLASKPFNKKSVTEETFRELETLKNKKVDEIKAVEPVPLHQDILENFEELKMEESLPETSRKKVAMEDLKKPTPEKQEPGKPQDSEVDLLKELQQLAKLEASPTRVVPQEGVAESGGPQEKTQKDSESFDSIVKKFGSLSVESEPVKVEISSARVASSTFQSKLRTLPKTSRFTTESGTGESYVVTKKEGTPGADMQSLYVGLIQERVYKNWREPLAEEHNQEVVVSFFIFPGGNIDKPFVKKSSGVNVLDTLAVRAVLDSVPFPEFPKELKMSNLHINIYFKYVPKDN
ncbi:MAG: hypothetical protein COW89_11920 [Nitrospinae bacterium CG22_combo_CG10-13_8_21_14_all_47_10]|nr:MAG: hypothetical protein COW89_11920 [Nitrospinae bacterium CG22_combo_CG10-13_8_21_14_all_47_10]